MEHNVPRGVRSGELHCELTFWWRHVDLSCGECTSRWYLRFATYSQQCNYAVAGNVVGSRYAAGTIKCDLSMCDASVLRAEADDSGRDVSVTPSAPSSHVPTAALYLICVAVVLVVV